MTSDERLAALQAWRDSELVYAEMVRPLLQANVAASVSADLELDIGLARREADSRRAAYFAQLRGVNDQRTLPGR